jgi:perosamine synthetase
MKTASQETFVTDVLQILESSFSGEKEPVSLHEPLFKGREWEYTKECLDTGWVSSVGKFVDRFEADLATYLGVKHAIATSNGTAALHICLLLAGVKPGDEVIAPTLTFVATANAISYCHAIPHFVDSEPSSMGLDVPKLRRHLQETCALNNGLCINRETGRPIRALVAMHTFGHSVDLDPLISVCEEFHLTLIEDAAESLGTRYKKRHTGGFGKTAAFSFNGNKIITTGGGGAVVTNDTALAKHAKHLTTTAKISHPWRFDHDEIGFNYRMPNLNAALGCAQLEKLPDYLGQKKKLAIHYQGLFKNLKGARIFSPPTYSESNFWLNALVLDNGFEIARDTILERAQTRKWMLRPAWTLMHRLPMYNKCPRSDLSQSERLERQTICLPSSAKLAENP